MKVLKNYLRWVFGTRRYNDGVRLGDYVWLPVYTPLALLQDIALKRERRSRIRGSI